MLTDVVLICDCTDGVNQRVYANSKTAGIQEQEGGGMVGFDATHTISIYIDLWKIQKK